MCSIECESSMHVKSRAKLILLEIEALQSAEPDETSNILTLVNEVIRDAKQLAEETLKEVDKAA